MYQSPEQFVATSKGATDALLNNANTVLAGAEQITTLNFSAMRIALEYGASNTEALLATKDAKEAVALQSSLVQPSVELAVSYSRNVCEVAAETQKQFARQIEVQFSDIQKQVMAMINQTAKPAPEAFDAAAATVKSASAVASLALDSMDKATRKFIEMTERNVAVAGDASVAVVGKE